MCLSAEEGSDHDTKGHTKPYHELYFERAAHYLLELSPACLWRLAEIQHSVLLLTDISIFKLF